MALHRFKAKLEGIGPGEAWVKLEVPQVALERDDGPREVDVPVALAKALKKEGPAKVFDALTPSCRQQYATWIADAKAEDTHVRRIAKALPMIAERKRLEG